MNTNSIPPLPEKLELDRPLVVFDLEATGLNKRMDRIVSIAFVRYEPGKEPVSNVYFLNPTIPIPAESTKLHHITDADVAEAPTFAEMASVIEKDFAGADLAGYNLLGFDIPLLCEEFARAGHPFDLKGRRVLDAQRIYFAKHPRNLSAALMEYCGVEHEDAHDAMGDVLATVQVLAGQFRKHPDLPTDMDTLDREFNQHDPTSVDRSGRLKWVDGEVTLNFGKFQGRRLRNVIREEPGVINWLLRSDFPEDTKRIVRDAQQGKYPPPPSA
jgi:DNA polymerase-3 subunit epsilon